MRAGATCRRRTVSSVLVHLVVIGAAVLIGFPFFYMLSTSLKTVKEVYTIPMVILPAAAAMAQLRGGVESASVRTIYVQQRGLYGQYHRRRKFMMGLMAGYAFARLRFPKKDLIFFLVLLTFLIPSEITLIPRFIMLKPGTGSIPIPV